MQQKDENGYLPAERGMRRSTTPLQRLLQRGGDLDATRSLGEALVPFFLGLVEACWFAGLLIGLAGVDFLHTNQALLPFWGPPLLLCVSLWLFQRILRAEASSPQSAAEPEQERRPAGVGLLFGVLALLDVGLIWLLLYAGTNFLLDPRWLLNWLNDVLLLNEHFYQTLAIVFITFYLCWRSTKLVQMHIEPGHVWRQMWVGLLILLASILLRAGRGKLSGNFDDVALVILIPAFLYFALSAHALARISFIRRAHPFGLEGSIAAQERAMLSIIGGAGLILLICTLIGAGVLRASFFDALQPAWQGLAAAYSWVANGLSFLLAWLLSPIFWLVQWLSTFTRNSKTTQPPQTGSPVKPNPPLNVAASPALVFAVQVILPLLLVLAMVLVVWFALRRRKRLRVARNRASGDVHESVWSWGLFWRQFKAFWAALFRRGQAQDGSAASTAGADDLPAEQAARTIREIYRALLRQAATLGYVRRRHETPHEFQQRLDQLRASDSEPQLGQLTEAYALTRYGGDTPGEFDLAHARKNWEELSRKWAERT